MSFTLFFSFLLRLQISHCFGYFSSRLDPSLLRRKERDTKVRICVPFAVEEGGAETERKGRIN